MRKSEIIRISVAFGLLVGTVSGLASNKIITTGEAIEIILLFGLVVVTAIYARRTSDIADATREQAKEMREQRYDAIRPIIDIERPWPLREEDRARELIAATSGDLSVDLACNLRNIGLGPAIDVYSFTKMRGGESRRRDFGTLAKNQEAIGSTSLSVQQKGSRIFLVVYYRDVYGRNFESSREVKLDREKQRWELGRLDTHFLKEEELP